jgi:hypothetical protein
MMERNVLVVELIRAGYRRFRAACQSSDKHNTAGDEALTQSKSN